MTDILKINPADNVVVAIQPLSAGAVIEVDGKTITVQEDIPAGLAIFGSVFDDFKHDVLRIG